MFVNERRLTSAQFRIEGTIKRLLYQPTFPSHTHTQHRMADEQVKSRSEEVQKFRNIGRLVSKRLSQPGVEAS